MIPKIIHYCWFGGNPLPESAKRCIESWRKYLPDYEIKEWNETNFNVNSVLYTAQAYAAKKYAFVTDYVRLYALKKEGGIYMDTDVEVIKSFTPFLSHNAFSGFESNDSVPTGMMASEKEGKWVTDLIEDYVTRNFFREDGSLDMTTNTFLITEYMKNAGLKLNNTFQDFAGLVTIYPSDFFCPKDHGTGIIKLTDNSVCIHHFEASWISRRSWTWRRHQLKMLLIKILGEKTVNKLFNH